MATWRLITARIEHSLVIRDSNNICWGFFVGFPKAVIVTSVFGAFSGHPDTIGNQSYPVIFGNTLGTLVQAWGGVFLQS